ncbi:MAG TPA: methylated-DNA--[protein]-cysteine S-methyltransferase [Nitrospirae bacterium]|nr:methylated-DNA--protein-cysteine methyltransferase [bacterium BMS3Abin10]GBE38636.1 methylated-DNA--protein-cysteine methyltransferase [bacterium BMS3Bbin08]HDH51295.1 methylated-DNA--[protein]-cysteine S-methyltransferase [Nitrospirota bacterium]HDK16922.1 methylated-DNA--[protein]-cysteine S-methyltransferase [Nitrospirota bacterium]HDK81349.1 methylated-DNA--[protein]-cysteine S-methyltransferase [Nitrospirota bacterium]
MSKPSIVYDMFSSPMGTLYLIFSGRSLAGISFSKPGRTAYRKNSAPKTFTKELLDYFQGADKGFTQKIIFLEGTDFEKKVWSSLNDIPFGETRTYKWVADKIGNPAASRAAGQALSKNPIPIVLPCHRVIESDGSIGGYSSGVNIKRKLLDLEYYSKMDKK